MDVTCERCGTEYEFDETLVSDRGTTVKCTNCGHLFKVFRPDGGPAGKSWTVRTADGGTRSLGSLKELQRLITDGALAPSDLISRGGEDYKRLGDIAELSTFFAAAAAANADTDAASGPDGRPRRATTPGVSERQGGMSERPGAQRGLATDQTAVDSSPGPDATHREPPRAPPPRRPKSTMIGVGAAPPPDRPQTDRTPPSAPPRPPARAPASQPPSRPPGPPSRPAPADETARARPGSRPPKPPPRPPRRPTPAQTPAASSTPAPAPSSPAASSASSSAPAASGPPGFTRPAARPERALYLDDHEVAAPPRGRSRSGLWVGLVVLLASAVGVALAWPQIAPVLGMAEEADPANPHTESGDASLASDTIEGYEGAVHHYTQALAYDENDSGVLTRLSRSQALWAQALSFDASDLDAMAADDPARAGEAAAIRRELRRHAETALERAENAVRHSSGDAAAEVALADALRLTGDLSRARSRLERGLTLQSEPSAETLRVRALVESAEQGGDLSAARERAEQAVAEDPGMIRARLLYARALLAAREVSDARSQIEAVLRRDAQHPRALALRDAIEEGRPPAPATVEVPDGGVPDAGAAAPDPQPEADTDAPTRAGGAAAARSDDGDPGSGAVPSGRDYSWYIRQADERIERGDTQRAQQLYEAARGVRPGGSEALTGLGYVALESGDANGAASRFRQAAGQGYAEAYIGLGAAYRRLGRTQDALTAYERYLERLPSGPRASIARRQTEELRRQLGSSTGDQGAGGGQTGGGQTGGGETGGTDDAPPAGGGTDTPTTPPGALPAPRDMEEPPPEDTPAIGSEP